MSGRAEIVLRPVLSRRDRRSFIRVARAIYPEDCPWVQPLDSIVSDHLNQRRNPFYRHGYGQAFIALRGGQPVGRILAHVWNRHHRLHQERVGYFGLFECVNDPPVAKALLSAAAQVACDRGCDVLRGPFNITAAQEIGIVTKGFEHIPATDMVYTPPWYPSLLESAGLRCCFRMRTWRNDEITAVDPDTMLSSGHRVLETKHGLRIRLMHPHRRSAELEQVREIVNAAFVGNWSFVPITRREWEFQVAPLVPLLDPALVLFAEVQEVPVGVTFAAPDFAPVVRRLNGGLLRPTALSLFRRQPTAVIILFAVRKQYQGLGVSRLLNAELIGSLKRRGYRSLSITWIGSDNHASMTQAKALGMRPLHDLAMYERSA